MADGDDLVAGLELEAGVDAHQRDRAVAHRDRVLDPDEGGEPLLELDDALAAGQHPALEDGGDGGDLFGPDIGSCDRNHADTPGRSGDGARSRSEPSSVMDV